MGRSEYRGWGYWAKGVSGAGKKKSWREDCIISVKRSGARLHVGICSCGTKLSTLQVRGGGRGGGVVVVCAASWTLTHPLRSLGGGSAETLCEIDDFRDTDPRLLGRCAPLAGILHWVEALNSGPLSYLLDAAVWSRSAVKYCTLGSCTCLYTPCYPLLHHHNHQLHLPL